MAAHHIYMDDWLIASTDEATHVQHLGEVFRRLQAGGLVLNVEKCQFGVKSEWTPCGLCRCDTAPQQCGNHQDFSPASQHQAAYVLLRHVKLLHKIHPSSCQGVKNIN